MQELLKIGKTLVKLDTQLGKVNDKCVITTKRLRRRMYKLINKFELCINRMYPLKTEEDVSKFGEDVITWLTSRRKNRVGHCPFNPEPRTLRRLYLRKGWVL